ncbi:MAG: hypothetical protein PHW46_02285 [Candidatus Omnitrophica bacterium]|nr:hypothetical protein [Candidatus Omnitrophota bacterium]
MSENPEKKEKAAAKATGKTAEKEVKKTETKAEVKEVKAEAAPAAAEAPKAPAPAEQAPQKGLANQPKKTESLRMVECAACGKTLKAKIWYYHNNAYYCTKKCYKRKLKEPKEKPAQK